MRLPKLYSLLRHSSVTALQILVACQQFNLCAACVFATGFSASLMTSQFPKTNMALHQPTIPKSLIRKLALCFFGKNTAYKVEYLPKEKWLVRFEHLDQLQRPDDEHFFARPWL